MSSDEDLRKEFIDKIKVTSKEPFKAEFILDENKNCGFLDSQGLCSIHSRLGHNGLCDTCKIYPRLFYDVNGEIETFLTLSCEAAVKISLFNSSIMRFEEAILELDEPFQFQNKLNVSEYTPSKEGVDIFWKLRITSIFILQSRKYELWLRLVLLGLFIKHSDELLLAERDAELMSFADDFIVRIEKGVYDRFIGEIQSNHDVKIKFLMYILKNLEHKSNGLLDVCINQMKEGLDIASGEQKLSENFIKSYKEYYLPFFERKEYILENYVVNLAFMSGFPFSYNLEKSIFRNYVKLIVKCSLIKFLLIGI